MSLMSSYPNEMQVVAAGFQVLEAGACPEDCCR